MNTEMTAQECISILQKELLCVDRECDTSRCAGCDLMMPDAEPIKEALKMAINSIKADKEAYSRGWTDGANAAKEHFDLRQAEKEGHWEKTRDHDIDDLAWYRCSECQKEICIAKMRDHRYCRNCGAKMEVTE